MHCKNIFSGNQKKPHLNLLQKNYLFNMTNNIVFTWYIIQIVYCVDYTNTNFF